MNATEVDVSDRHVDVETQAGLVIGVLREYSSKFAALTAELLDATERLPRSADLDRLAWLLDRSELLRKPIATILSRGSGLRENAPLKPITRDELSLRMFETEVHLHHAIRLTLALRDRLAERKLSDGVAKLRVTAGLPGSGPLAVGGSIVVGVGGLSAAATVGSVAVSTGSAST